MYSQVYDQQLGLIPIPGIVAAAGGINLKRLPIIGGIFAKGKCPPSRPGFTASMCRDPRSLFFVDRFGYEWEWFSQSGGPEGTFNLKGGRCVNLKDPKAFQPGNGRITCSSTDPRVGPDTLEDLRNLVAYGDIRGVKPGESGSVTRPPAPGRPMAAAAVPGLGPTGGLVLAGLAAVLLLGGKKKR